jgi:hypothetical protein
MADHTRNYGSSLPTGTDRVGTFYTEIGQFKDDNKQRLTLDHYMDDVLTDGAANQDGRHRQVTMKESASEPTAIADTGIVYTKDVDGGTELFYRDDSSNDVQITSGGDIYKEDFEDSLTGIFSDAAKVTGTAGSAGGTGSYAQVTVSYPTASWNKNNSVVLSSKIEDSSGNIRDLSGFFITNSPTSSYTGAEVIFGNSDITIRTAYEFNGGDFEIVLGLLS